VVKALDSPYEFNGRTPNWIKVGQAVGQEISIRRKARGWASSGLAGAPLAGGRRRPCLRLAGPHLQHFDPARHRL
jgi:ATP-dependent DNA ligase